MDPRTGLYVLLVLAWPSSAQGGRNGPASGPDLTQMSLEDLAKVTFTTASRRAQSAFDVAAPVFVITQDDIRRSGATHIAEVLRMAPGVQVARIDQNKWAVTIRGFNARYANKLLVLVDGRSVYTPSFSGVLWETLDLPLEDIERIEVIRGPGGALWGANAVNGIINIITYHSRETHGTEVSLRSGDRDSGGMTIRSGGSIGPDAHFRVFGKFDGTGASATQAGDRGSDGWNGARAGFRMDWDKGQSNRFLVSGDIFEGDYDQSMAVPSAAPPFMTVATGRYREGVSSLMGRWVQTASSGAEQTLQVSWDHLKFRAPQARFATDTLDVDWQRALARAGNQSVTFGLGYRLYNDNIPADFNLMSNAGRRSLQTISGFVDDEVVLGPRVRATLGSKLEQNSYTGIEFQPSVRIAWTPNDRRTAWASASRAVRTPARSDRDIMIRVAGMPGEGGVPMYATTFGNPDFSSETVTAYEAGYRVRPTNRLSVDVAAFYNVYGRLRSMLSGQPYVTMASPSPYVTIPVWFQNQQGGDTHGAEVQGNWHVTDLWRLSAAYTFLDVHLRLPDDGDTIAGPSHQLSFRSQLDLRRSVEFDTALYLVGPQSYTLQGASRSIPGYLRVDVRLGWRPNASLNAAVGIANLLDARHVEFGDVQNLVANQVERSVYGSLTWRL